MDSTYQELEAATKAWMDKASAIYGQSFIIPHIRMNIRGCTAGRANFAKWELQYNPVLFIQNKQDFIASTIPHEIAHLVANAMSRSGRVKPHGYEWREVMYKLGISKASRCHSYDTSKLYTARPRPYVYACKCKEHRLTSIIHRRIVAGQTRSCLHCHTRVELVRVEDR